MNYLYDTKEYDAYMEGSNTETPIALFFGQRLLKELLTIFWTTRDSTL